MPTGVAAATLAVLHGAPPTVHVGANAMQVPHEVFSRIVLTGGRRYDRSEVIRQDLLVARRCGGRYLAHGAHGVHVQPAIVSADALADRHARTLGFDVERVPVDTAIDGPWPHAGCIRNARLLLKARPTIVLAYPDASSSGTWDCAARAIELGIPLLVRSPTSGSSVYGDFPTEVHRSICRALGERMHRTRSSLRLQCLVDAVIVHSDDATLDFLASVLPAVSAAESRTSTDDSA